MVYMLIIAIAIFSIIGPWLGYGWAAVAGIWSFAAMLMAHNTKRNKDA